MLVDGREITIEYLDLAKVHPNPWNPNRQNERTFEAERESIRSYGFIVPMLVRAHPEIEGEHQIIDGEHRWRGAQEEGLTRGPAIVVDGFDESEVRKLTLALNMHGDAEIVPLSRLLVELSQSIPDLEALRLALPYSGTELDELLKIGQVDWGNFDLSGQTQVEEHLRQASNSQYTVFFAFDKGQRERFDKFMEILARELGSAFTREEATLSALSGACQNL